MVNVTVFTESQQAEVDAFNKSAKMQIRKLAGMMTRHNVVGLTIDVNMPKQPKGDNQHE